MPRALPDALLALPHRRDVPFSRLTTMGIGGACRWLFEPVDESQAQAFVRTCRAEGLPFRVLGAGSNLVVMGDEELPVLRLRLQGRIERHGNSLSATATPGLIALSTAAAEAGLSGLEWACGIPGSCGGALHMNAGSGSRETVDVLGHFRYLTPEGDRIERRPEPGDFRYRWSFLRSGHVALGLTFDLAESQPDPVRAAMATLKARRVATQPQGSRSAGSTFKNPPGDAAGRLIEAAGLKGLQVGAVAVSSVHANFLVNLGDGTPEQWSELVARIRERVREAHGIELELEVELWRT